MTVVEVDLGSRSYPVHVGAGVRELLPEVLPADARRVAVITQDNVRPWVPDPGREHIVLTVPDGEEAKSLAVVEDICRQMAAAELTRAYLAYLGVAAPSSEGA